MTASLIKKMHTLKQWIIRKSILEDMKTYVAWYFWTIYRWHRHILSLIFPLIWFMISVILWIQKTTSFCFTFTVVIVNSIIYDYSRFLTSWNLALIINWCEVLVLNASLKLLVDSQAMNYFKVWLCFPYHSICKKRRFDTHNIIKV